MSWQKTCFAISLFPISSAILTHRFYQLTHTYISDLVIWNQETLSLVANMCIGIIVLSNLLYKAHKILRYKCLEQFANKYHCFMKQCHIYNVNLSFFNKKITTHFQNLKGALHEKLLWYFSSIK